MKVEVGLPRDMLGRDGVTRSAIPYQVSQCVRVCENDTFWLDSNGRIERWDEACDPVVHCAGGDSVNWDVRGLLPPYGIAWPTYVHGGTLAMEAFDHGRVAKADWDSHAGLLKVNSPVQSFYAFNAGATFSYDGNPAPTQTHIPLFGGGWLNLTRTSFRELGHFTAPASWPDENWSLGPPGDILPGRTRVLPGWQHSLQDFMDQLRNNTEARQAWDSGCMIFALLMPPTSATLTAPPPANVATTRYEDAVFGIQNADGEASRWSVGYSNDATLPGHWKVERQESTLARSCSEANHAQVAWQDAFANAQSYVPANVSVHFTYELAHRSHQWSSSGAPAFYDLAYPPLGATNNPVLLHATLNALDGRPEAFQMQRDDLQHALAVLAHGQ